MSLVLDLMEEFKSIAVDRPLMKLTRTNPSSLANLLSEDGEKKSESVKHVWRLLNENMKTAKPPNTVARLDAGQDVCKGN
jgi:CRISPR/Cas system-associated endonuclease Cas1